MADGGSSLNSEILNSDLLEAETTSLFGPTVSTDKDDYAPGEIVTITASGFEVGSSIEFAIADDPLDPGDDGDADVYEPFIIVDGGIGDLDGIANGQVVTTFLVPTDDDGSGIGTPDALNATLDLIATGNGADGTFETVDDEVAITTFTDSGGAYTLNFAAADPSIYLPPIPFPNALGTDYVSGGRGNGSTLIALADFNDGTSDVRVESLAPQDMALGQIVPFETKISVSGETTPEDGVITFVISWNTLTTNGDDFGYDARPDDIGYGVIEAFIDTSDGAHVDPGNDAQVDSFTWSVINDEIVGIFTVSGLDDGDTVVLEPWLVLDDTIPAGVGGNVQSRLIDAATGSDQTINVANSGSISLVNGDAISTGNQTVPLLKPSDFFNADVDLSITKTDDSDPIAPGGTLTYTITASNAGPSVANSVVIYDELDPNVTFMSASDGGFINNDATDSIPNGAVQWDVGALAPGASVEYSVSRAGDMQICNDVT